MNNRRSACNVKTVLSYLVGSELLTLWITIVIIMNDIFRCRYSQALKPIFDKTAESLHNEHPVSVVMACCYSDMCEFCRVRWCWVELTVRHPVSITWCVDHQNTTRCISDRSIVSVNVPHNKIPYSQTVEKWTIGKERISRTGNAHIFIHSPVVITILTIRDPQQHCQIMLKANLLILLKSILKETPWASWYAISVTVFLIWNKFYTVMQLYSFTLHIPLLYRKLRKLWLVTSSHLIAAPCWYSERLQLA